MFDPDSFLDSDIARSTADCVDIKGGLSGRSAAGVRADADKLDDCVWCAESPRVLDLYLDELGRMSSPVGRSS
jgi:hypothetical protein